MSVLTNVKPKHVLVLLVVLSTLLAVVIVTQTTGRGAASRVIQAPVNFASVVDDTSRTLDISWMGIASFPGADEGSWIQCRLEERFNLRLQPIFLDWSAFSNRRPLMFAGGNVPDVFWEGDPLGVQRLVRQGFVLEIPWELLVQRCPNYVRSLNQFGPEAWLYSHYQGRNWGVPTCCPSGTRTRAGVWRMDWLRKVGIEKVPETFDEVHEAFRRFTLNDPDGDGRRNTYGTCPNAYWSLVFTEFFAAENVLPFEFVQRDGRVVWGGTLPEAKRVLGMLRQWYSEGLIDPDYVTQGNSNSSGPEQALLTGRVGYIFDQSEFNRLNLERAGSLANMMQQLQPQAELVPSAPLRGSDGVQRSRVWGGAAHVLCFGAHLAREPEKVLRVLDMLETLATDRELAIEASAGKRGMHWDFSPQRGIFRLPPFDRSDAASRQMLSDPAGNAFFAVGGNPPEFVAALRSEGEHRFAEQFNRAEWGIKNVLGKSDVVPAAADYLADLRQYQLKVYAQIVRGDVPLDAFDEFAKQWHRRGGQKLLDEANELLAERHEIYRRVGATKAEATP